YSKPDLTLNSVVFCTSLAPMSVKEVLQSLVDDNMVDSERVGTSNYYWAFPSKALHARKRRLEELEKQNAEGSQRRDALLQAVEKAKEGREESEERAALQKELAGVGEQRETLQAELEKYRECDPEVVEEMLNLGFRSGTFKAAYASLFKGRHQSAKWKKKHGQHAGKENITAKEAVSRWTDNVFAIKSWAKRKFCFEDSQLDKAFGIPEDFDYMD
ncbi:hypothetical protein P4O66_012701, partial [Electrophorus voltai]